MNVILQRNRYYGKYRIRMKQIIRLTESDIHNIVRQVIKEIDYRGAALTHGANYNAQQDYMNSRNPNARTVSYSDKTTHSRKLHTLLPHNEEQIKRVLTFVSNYLYAREDYETNINTNGSTPSKPH